tara:strand:- start:1164 stop:2027 length:864 start_codon:yes stop_codon:yes gene_type:complete
VAFSKAPESTLRAHRRSSERVLFSPHNGRSQIPKRAQSQTLESQHHPAAFGPNPPFGDQKPMTALGVRTDVGIYRKMSLLDYHLEQRAVRMPTAEHFWDWFLQHEEELRSIRRDRRLFQLLGEHLLILDIPKWEIGPFDTNGSKHFLALSGSKVTETGKRNREQLLEMDAPSTWMILPFRPPKRWSRQFQWGPDRVSINANGWLFEVHKFDDGMFDLILHSDIHEISNAAEKRDALITALDNELGEAGMIEKINAVELRVNVDSSDRERLIPMSHLKEIILSEARKR